MQAHAFMLAQEDGVLQPSPLLPAAVPSQMHAATLPPPYEAVKPTTAGTLLPGEYVIIKSEPSELWDFPYSVAQVSW